MIWYATVTEVVEGTMSMKIVPKTKESVVSRRQKKTNSKCTITPIITFNFGYTVVGNSGYLFFQINVSTISPFFNFRYIVGYIVLV